MGILGVEERERGMEEGMEVVFWKFRMMLRSSMDVSYSWEAKLARKLERNQGKLGRSVRDSKTILLESLISLLYNNKRDDDEY